MCWRTWRCSSTWRAPRATGTGTWRGASWRPDRVGQLQAGAIADMVVVDVPVTDVVGTIEAVARHGAGRQVETVVSGRVRWSAV